MRTGKHIFQNIPPGTAGIWKKIAVGIQWKKERGKGTGKMRGKGVKMEKINENIGTKSLARPCTRGLGYGILRCVDFSKHVNFKSPLD